MAVDDKHGPKLYSRLLEGLLATVKLDAPYPMRRMPSHTRKPVPRVPSSLGSTATSPSRSSISPVRPNAAHLNIGQIYQIQVDDGQNSPVDGSSGGSPSSMQGLNVQEFFAPPLPFDGELLHSMQNLTNSTEWEGMALPGMHCFLKVLRFPAYLSGFSGWNWMGGLQPSGETHQGAPPPGSFPPLPSPDVFSAGEFSAPNFQGF